MQSPTELTSAFRARGLKVTPQRQLLFRLLHDDHSHPTAEALFARASTEMPGISLRTVYQTLNDLAAMDELRAVSIGSGAVRFDPNIADHHHVVCDVCGAVRDVYLRGAEVLERELSGQLTTDDDFDGFDIDRVAVTFTGRCPRCTADADRPATGSSVPDPNTPKEKH